MVAGALSLEDGAKVVALRSRLLRAIAGKGAMASVALPASDVRIMLERNDGGLAIAAVNGPAATVVAGDPSAVDELLADCERAGVRTRRIEVDYASHCAHVDEIRDELIAVLDDIRPATCRVHMYSTLDTGWLEGANSPPNTGSAICVARSASNRRSWHSRTRGTPHSSRSARIRYSRSASARRWRIPCRTR